MDGTVWPLACVELNVSGLEAVSSFYRSLGLEIVSSGDGVTHLGVEGRSLLALRNGADISSRSTARAGLYHLALLVPAEADLAAFAAHGLVSGLRFTDASDHIVSKALYLSDPEGNGVEVYADRSRETWRWDGATVEMASNPIDVEALAQAGSRWTGFPRGTRLGHVHLRVGDLDRSQAFYEGIGMQVTARIPGARFMSWDGYHHHIGINIWSGGAASPITSEAPGLRSITLRRNGRGGGWTDPDGVAILLEDVTQP